MPRGILAVGGHVPRHRLRRDAAAAVIGGRGRGTRAVASYDEDTTTMAVAAARRALAGTDVAPRSLVLATATPAYHDKTNAAAIHAALRLDEDVLATDAGGALRSGIAALLLALRSDDGALVVASDIRTGLPGGSDELAGGDGAAAIVTGTGDDVLAEVLGGGSATAEFVDRWRAPGDTRSRQWEDRFVQGQYRPLGAAAASRALDAAGVAVADVDHVVVTGMHARSASTVLRDLGATTEQTVDALGATVGTTGTAHPLLLLTDVLERATAGGVVLLVSLADGADALVLRRTDVACHTSPSVAEQVAHGDDSLRYAQFLAWRGMITKEPPRRPDPARYSASAAARNRDWKYGFVGGLDEDARVLHLPPAADTVPTPMAGRAATVATFTVDRVAQSPSPPTIFAVLDFDGGGRYPCELTDVREEDVHVGMRVEMAFRLVNTADGLHNYGWKGCPRVVADRLRSEASSTSAGGPPTSASPTHDGGQG